MSLRVPLLVETPVVLTTLGPVLITLLSFLGSVLEIVFSDDTELSADGACPESEDGHQHLGSNGAFVEHSHQIRNVHTCDLFNSLGGKVGSTDGLLEQRKILDQLLISLLDSLSPHCGEVTAAHIFIQGLN